MSSRSLVLMVGVVSLLLWLAGIDSILDHAWAESKPPNAATSMDTKGTPFRGGISGSDGKEIAQLEFFGEGTSEIYFDGRQRLILEDEKGNIIAGFKGVALEPAKRGITQAYVVQEEDGSRPMMLEHEVAEVEYRGGNLKLRSPQPEMLTSFKVNGKQMTIRFKSIDQIKNDKGQLVNRLIVSSDDGQEFEFAVRPSTSMLHTLKRLKGDLVAHLTEKQKRMQAELGGSESKPEQERTGVQNPP